MRSVVLITGLIGAASVSGCVTAAVGAAAGMGAIMAQERSVGTAFDDGTAASELRARLVALDGRGFADVSIEVVDGRLLLSGTAPTPEHRIDAERIAWSIEQIQAVANEIEVGGATGLWRTSLDEAVTLQVRARMIAADDVRAVNVNIETSRGTVYLMGIARSEEEIQRAAEIASLTPGVRRVVSYMHLREPRVRIGPPMPAEQAQNGPGIGVGAAAAPVAPSATGLGAPLDLNAPVN